MGYSINAFRAKAAESYKGLPITDESTGELLFTLRSTVRLSDSETTKLGTANAALKKYQESKEDTAAKPSDLKRYMINILAALADQPDALRSFLADEDLGVVTEVFKAYQEETQAPEGN